MLDRLIHIVKGDRILWLVILCLSIFSLLAVYSATGTLAFKYRGGNTGYYLLKQIAILFGGLGVVYLAHLLDYRYYSKLAQLLLIATVPLLIYTLFFGTSLNQASRWITLPGIGITFQTSDLAKLALIMYMARILSRKQEEIKDFQRAFLPVITPVILICLLIAPDDLSTALILFMTCILLMFIGRIHLGYIAATLGMGALGVALLLATLFIVPEDLLPKRMPTWKHRIERHFGIADPAASSVTESYQVVQSKIAIANGGIFPNGPGNSTQRNFLPHPYSDFIYAIIIEEYGLLGGAFIVGLYLLFLFRCIRIVIRAPKAFGALLAVGLGLSLTIQAMVNMGVAVNLLPVTGMTLPLVSMGGSSVIFTSVAIGIILSVSRETEPDDDAPQSFRSAALSPN